MTEPRYGGADSQGRKGVIIKGVKESSSNDKKQDFRDFSDASDEIVGISEEAEKNFRKAGEIAFRVLKYAEHLCRPETPLVEIAEKVEEKIYELKAVPAFPIDLSINEIAAHYSPLIGDKSVAKGVIKIDLGVALNGYVIDTAKTLDLTPENKFKELIKSSENALNEAFKILKEGIEAREIGKRIQETINKAGFAPIRNLSGHELGRYVVHAGLTIPNYYNNDTRKLHEGVYAIEPFSTTGEGVVQDGKPSGVFDLIEVKAVRDETARKILQFIPEEYKTLPFSARWIVKKFGVRALIALNMLENAGCIKQYPQLIEKSRAPVSQAENSFLIKKNKVEMLVKEE